MTVFVKTYSPPPFSETEALRYMGANHNADCNIITLVNDCFRTLQNGLCYKVCYAYTDISVENNVVDFGFGRVVSENLAKNLEGCIQAVIFAATIGLQPDRQINVHSTVSPVTALAFDAVGSERIEALCDLFNNDVKHSAENHGYIAKPRFSAGYGDLSIDFQQNIFKVLDCQRKIGLTLNGSLSMSPTKSVTAIIGLR